ncbi:hypothetical protein H9L12_02555 [Sphingomonas rhizophila]|uniref:Uncharacterized protein n=1 Tax=Sphingomonas rhizophila TaxID=2071607 RepID=A0A7G9SCC8_9SPHN|nr:hypothetical protein [Sphingomonas rhizophila]QNN65503.1 hypothetical protein H9L12_02555 [Sphingomonas rhizophila]
MLDPAALGLGDSPWGGAHGKVLSTMLRRMDAPLPSRWAHIGLRNALMVRGPAPHGVHPADWAAERAWLLLRMGEADGARLLTASVDTDRFTPKMFQVASQAALATSDPSGLCPLESGLSKTDKRITPLVNAMCASLSGEAERAAADIESARRRGSIGGIDLALADKVVGAGADTARAVTIEWEPVQRLNAWRYGLASATGAMPPVRLVDAASPTLRAWMARSPIYSPLQKVDVARTAAALGVLSSSAYVDLYSAVFDATDPDELGETDAWKLRLAYVGRNIDDRLSAMRDLWGAKSGKGNDRFAAQVLTARAATLVPPSAKYAADAPDLIASMLAAGYDQAAARWIPVLADMDDKEADECWAMLALGAPSANGLEIDANRIEDFADRDESKDKRRTALLVAGLAGLGRIDGETAGALNGSYRLGLGGTTQWTRMIDGAAARRQAGTAMIFAASGLQGSSIGDVRGLYQFHGITALKRVGLDFLARMVAAEALARA